VGLMQACWGGSAHMWVAAHACWGGGAHVQATVAMVIGWWCACASDGAPMCGGQS
jgi:hypothetical protein